MGALTPPTVRKKKTKGAPMKKFCLLLLTMCLLAGGAMASNCGWPYNCVGQVADTMVIKAHGSLITGTYIGEIANFTDYVRIVNVSQDKTSGWLIQNTMSPVTFFTDAIAGDTLVVQICAVPDWLSDKSCHDDPQVRIFASDPNFSEDGKNHAYVYKNTPNPFAQIGMEDLADEWASDWDYNDLEFYLFNIDVTPGSLNAGDNAATPEPASLILLGTGIAAALRKARKQKV